MSLPRSVALVGRPNVGKSRLFNRLLERRVSIVHDQPGVTRDLVTANVPAKDGGYLLMDTGGMAPPPGAASAAIVEAVEEQVDFAVQAASLVVFVTDAREGLTTADERIAERLRAYHKPTLLVANKADHPRQADAVAEFYKLGFGEPLAISAEHGRGMDELSEKILRVVGPMPETEAGAEGAAPVADPSALRAKFALVGRPNVGKSSLANALLQSKRLIVNETPGTTRDTIAIDLDYAAPNGEKWAFTLLDTAGLRPAAQVNASVEYFSQNRSRQAIAECDVGVLVLDALSGVTKQDKFLAGEILRAGAGLVIVVNKWDHARKKFEKDPLPGYKNEAAFKKAFVEAVQKELFFLPRSPVLFTSALEGTAVTDILQEVRQMHEISLKQLPTAPLNRFLRESLESNPPKFVQGRRFKCYYALQVARRPFVIRMYCNHAGKLDERYTRYLESGVSEAFKLRGCPIRFELVGKPKRDGPKRGGFKKKFEVPYAKTGKPGKLPPAAED
jgi:GTP-binding protein